MIQRDFLVKFLEFCKEYGYASAYDQTDCIDSFLNSRLLKEPTNWEWEKESQRHNNMHLFYSVINEYCDPEEIYLVRKEDNKIVGRLVDAKFE